MKDRAEIVYSLNVEDIQTVAEQEMGRELSDDEIDRVIDALGEQINWYEAILFAILETQAKTK
ncbi:MAG: hypothetical protein Fur0043_12500 [Anaerolineales bacterium]